MMQEISIKKRNTGRKAICLIRALLLTGLLFSCADERFTSNVVTEDDETECVFTVSLPAQVKTYALNADTDENDINRMDVLVFKYNSVSEKYLLADWSAATEDAIADNGSSNKKTFTVRFTRLIQGDSYKFVLLANAENGVKGLFIDGITIGAEKEFVLSRLTLTNVSRWVMNPNDGGYKCIPMWGETSSQDGSGDIEVSENTTMPELKLLRMLARINITIDDEGSNPVTSDFKLKNVYLYNAYTSGHVAPAKENLEPGSVLKVKAPTLVAGSTVVKGPILYDYYTDGSTLTETALINNIYTFESELPYSAGEFVTDKMTCLVLGGKYKTDIDTTYYRVDLADQGAYINILRNHSYTVKVVSVSGRGYATPEEAFNTKKANMEAEVITWDDGSVSEIQFDGQYMLSVSQSEFTFTREKRDDASLDNLLTVTANHPEGWTIKITDNITPGVGSDATWLESDPETWSGSTTTDIRLLMNANETTAPRTAYIHITSGRLNYVVTVTQLHTHGLKLNVTSGGLPVTELVFTSVSGVKPTPQSFTVDWGPKTADLRIEATGTVVSTGNGDESFTQTVIAGNNGTGTMSFPISPPAILPTETGFPFVTKTSTMTFTVSDGVESMKKTLILTQINYALEASGIEEKYYMDGSTYSFTVKANDAWTAAITNNPERVNSHTLSGSGNISGETVSFTITDDVYGSTAGMYGPGTFDITFTSVNGTFSPVTYTINCSNLLWAGSNIYWDATNRKLTFDDAGVTTHENYQGVFFKWASLWGMSPATAGLIWWEYLAESDRIVYRPNGTGGHFQSTIMLRTDIPYLILNGAASVSPNAASKDENQTSDLGDICKYLSPLHGKNWRLPIAREFSVSSNYTRSGIFYDVNGIGTADGKFKNDNKPGYYKKSNGDVRRVFLPAAGYWDFSQMFGVGLNGYYWSSSSNGAFPYRLDFTETTISSESNLFNQNASPIRCVTEQ